MGGLTSIVSTRKAITNGNIPTIILCATSGILWLREKMITNEKRYKESGSTHKSGMGVMSVVMNAVTPSIMLDGTKANPIHLSLLKSVGAPESPTAKESPSEAAVLSGAPPPAPTGGLGEAPPAVASSSSCSAVVAGEE